MTLVAGRALTIERGANPAMHTEKAHHSGGGANVTSWLWQNRPISGINCT